MRERKKDAKWNDLLRVRTLEGVSFRYPFLHPNPNPHLLPHQYLCYYVYIYICVCVALPKAVGVVAVAVLAYPEAVCKFVFFGQFAMTLFCARMRGVCVHVCTCIFLT